MMSRQATSKALIKYKEEKSQNLQDLLKSDCIYNICALKVKYENLTQNRTNSAIS